MNLESTRTDTENSREGFTGSWIEYEQQIVLDHVIRQDGVAVEARFQMLCVDTDKSSAVKRVCKDRPALNLEIILSLSRDDRETPLLRQLVDAEGRTMFSWEDIAQTGIPLDAMFLVNCSECHDLYFRIPLDIQSGWLVQHGTQVELTSWLERHDKDLQTDAVREKLQEMREEQLADILPAAQTALEEARQQQKDRDYVGIYASITKCLDHPKTHSACLALLMDTINKLETRIKKLDTDGLMRLHELALMCEQEQGPDTCQQTMRAVNIQLEVLEQREAAQVARRLRTRHQRQIASWAPRIRRSLAVCERFKKEFLRRLNEVQRLTDAYDPRAYDKKAAFDDWVQRQAEGRISKAFSELIAVVDEMEALEDEGLDTQNMRESLVSDIQKKCVIQ